MASEMIGLNEQSLEDYVRLEKDIQLYEKRRVKETLNVRLEQLESITEEHKELEEEYKELETKTGLKGTTQNEEERENMVKNFLLEQEEYNEEVAYEKAEQLADLNRMEILRKKLEGVEAHKGILEMEIANLTEDVGKYAFLCEKQESMLASIFNGEYGSELENRLERELDDAEVWKQQVEVADFKWRQAHVMVEYSCKQLIVALSKWKELPKISDSNVQAKYKLSEETRNNLIAAYQNLKGAQKYLPDIKFPYCNETEVQTLFQATSYVFTDMQSLDRHKHATTFYTTTLKRCSALKQWFEEAIHKTLLDDLKKANDEVIEKKKDLHRERVNLLQMKVRETFGKNVDVDLEETARLITLEEAQDNEDRIARRSKEAEVNEGSITHVTLPQGSRAISPIPVSELAPQPSREKLFGKVRLLSEEHAWKMEEVKSAEQERRDRIKEGLSATLEQRRNRRARLRLQSNEIQDLATRIQKVTGIGGGNDDQNN